MSHVIFINKMLQNMRRSKLLYVDDNPLCLTLFYKILKNEFDIILANSGEEAIDILEREPSVGIVVSDWEMPGLSGHELLNMVHETYPGKVCFMLSGNTNYSIIEPSLQKGIIKKYFRKPLEPTAFLHEINRMEVTEEYHLSI